MGSSAGGNIMGGPPEGSLGVLGVNVMVKGISRVEGR